MKGEGNMRSNSTFTSLVFLLVSLVRAFFLEGLEGMYESL